jgi:hypothetical protein
MKCCEYSPKDRKCPKTFTRVMLLVIRILFIVTGASSAIRSPELRIVSYVCYHCASGRGATTFSTITFSIMDVIVTVSLKDTRHKH